MARIICFQFRSCRYKLYCRELSPFFFLFSSVSPTIILSVIYCCFCLLAWWQRISNSVQDLKASIKTNGRPYYSVTFSCTVNDTQGYRLTNFHQVQAGPLNQNDWGPSPKLRGTGFGGKINSFQHHCQAFASLIIEVGDLQNLYSSN